MYKYEVELARNEVNLNKEFFPKEVLKDMVKQMKNKNILVNKSFNQDTIGKVIDVNFKNNKIIAKVFTREKLRKKYLVIFGTYMLSECIRTMLNGKSCYVYRAFRVNQLVEAEAYSYDDKNGTNYRLINKNALEVE